MSNSLCNCMFQYGFVNHAIYLLVQRNFGEETWQKIKWVLISLDLLIWKHLNFLSFVVTIEVYRNKILAAWCRLQTVSVAKKPEILILISEFMSWKKRITLILSGKLPGYHLEIKPLIMSCATFKVLDVDTFEWRFYAT